MGLRRGSAQTLCLACTFPLSFLALPRARGRMKPSGPWSDKPSYVEVQSGTPGRGTWTQAHCFTCSLPGHICIVKAVGGQCLTGENVAQTVAFQILSCRAESPGKVSSSLCHLNSMGLWTSSSSVFCFADKEPEAQRDQGCPPVSGRAGAPRSPNSLLTRESASLWGQPVHPPDTCTPPLPATGAPKGRVTRVSAPGLLRTGWGGRARNAEVISQHVAEPSPPGRTRLSAGSRTGQSGRDRVPSRSPLRTLPPS